MNIRTIDNLDVRGKFVLLRCEFNVQIVDGVITDAFRIEQSMPTIRKLQVGGAKIAICAHLGRPKGEPNIKYSLAPVAEYLKVPLISDCLNRDFMADMNDGDIVLLENLRFHTGEEENNPDFSAKLAAGFDVFVNDAFGVSHRAHASTVGVAQILPSYAGELLLWEIKNLNTVMKNPTRPLMSIVGGAKVASKLEVLNSLVKLSDILIVGGGIGTAFAIATGANITDGLYDPNMRDEILKTIELARENNCEILMPIDKGVAREFDKNAARTDKTFDEIVGGDIILDDGVQTTARNIAAMHNVKTILWNGPVGMAEWGDIWGRSSFALARGIAELTRAGRLFSVVGGGDVVATLEETGTKDDISYVSTGGGAFLEFIEGKELPGIKVLGI
jgi:phosphoglycerate kinase